MDTKQKRKKSSVNQKIKQKKKHKQHIYNNIREVVFIESFIPFPRIKVMIKQVNI